jgi:hypothetical protein
MSWWKGGAVVLEVVDEIICKKEAEILGAEVDTFITGSVYDVP